MDLNDNHRFEQLNPNLLNIIYFKIGYRNQFSETAKTLFCKICDKVTLN